MSWTLALSLLLVCGQALASPASPAAPEPETPCLRAEVVLHWAARVSTRRGTTAFEFEILSWESLAAECREPPGGRLRLSLLDGADQIAGSDSGRRLAELLGCRLAEAPERPSVSRPLHCAVDEPIRLEGFSVPTPDGPSLVHSYTRPDGQSTEIRPHRTAP